MQKVIFFSFQDQMYIFRYKTPVFIQNLHILVKCFGKNFIFRVKSTNFLFFGTKCKFLGTKLQFLSKTTLFMQNLYILVKVFGKNFIFIIKSTIFSIFQDQMYIFGYKSTVFSIFNAISKFFCFYRTKCTFLGTKLQFLSKICTF